MTRRRLTLATGLCWLAGSAFAMSQAPPTPEELIAREKVRSAVEAAFELYGAPASSGAERIDNAIEAAESLEAIGSEIVLYVGNELDQDRPETFEFCVYALGLVDSPESEAALRRAIERAEQLPGGAARYRKAWAGWGLGIQGKVDAVDLLDEGVHLSASQTIHTNMSVLESAAVRNAPESLPLLVAQLERYGKREELHRERRWTLRALRRLGDPSAVPSVLPLLADPSPTIRADAARALGVMGTAEAVEGLLGLLDDKIHGVRRAASFSLYHLAPKVPVSRLTARLDVETDRKVRGFLYELVVRLQGKKAFKTLLPYHGRPEWDDRRHLVVALTHVGGPKAVKFLVESLSDPNNTVAGSAATGLKTLRTPAAVSALLETVPSASWQLLPFVAGSLGEIGVTEAGPAIVSRIAAITPADLEANRHVRHAVDRLGFALASLRYTEALPELRQVLERHTDHQLRVTLTLLIRKLETIAGNGDEIERWAATLSDDERQIRSLAYEQLLRLGGNGAAEALAGAFDDVEDDEKIEILETLGGLESPATVALVERVLTGIEFDPLDRVKVRNMAAWAARRQGTDAMFTLLESAADRRRGREAAVLNYAGVLGGKRALPLLERYQAYSLRYWGGERGVEQEHLAGLIRRLEAGKSLESYDLPPRGLGPSF